MGKLNQSQKTFLRDKSIEAARKYEYLFNNKKFLIITEDWDVRIISFRCKDFIHMTGLIVNLSDISFYQCCVKGTLAASNINTVQSHNINTLKQKTKSLAKLNYFIHCNAGTNLFLLDLETEKINNPFPAAIRNDQKNITMAFYKTELYGRSLRKASSSLNARAELLIKSIFEMDCNGKGCNIIYLRDSMELVQNVSNLNTLVSPEIYGRIHTASKMKQGCEKDKDLEQDDSKESLCKNNK